jgi:type VI secretion system protein ImpH
VTAPVREPDDAGVAAARPRHTRAADESLVAYLTRAARGVEFFQAVRLVEALKPGRDRVGGFGDPEREAVRFAVRPSLAFPTGDVESIAVPAGDRPAELSVNFMGLTGAAGVLPRYYTQQVAERVAARDTALRDFLDIFHHRILSLFYRAWRKLRPQANYGTSDDRLTAHLRDLIGLGTAGLAARLPIADDALLNYVALLAPRQRSAAALRQLVADYFRVPASVDELVGGWYAAAPGTQCALGADDASSRLGLGALVGDELWDPQGRARVRLGPLTRAQYDRFLPGGDAHAPLRALLRFFGGDEVDFEVQLVLARAHVRGLSLGGDGGAPLGWGSWLSAGAMTRDPDDAVLAM